MRRIAMVGLVMALLGAFALPALGHGKPPHTGRPDTPGRPIHTGRVLVANLTGAAEVPGPGDPDGAGKAWIWLNRGRGLVCYWIKVSNLDSITGGHIHVGAAGTAPVNNIVVPLFGAQAAGTTTIKGCVEDVAAALITAIRENPANYYVNVHTTVYPAGAIRGQLGKKLS